MQIQTVKLVLIPNAFPDTDKPLATVIFTSGLEPNPICGQSGVSVCFFIKNLKNCNDL